MAELILQPWTKPLPAPDVSWQYMVRMMATDRGEVRRKLATMRARVLALALILRDEAPSNTVSKAGGGLRPHPLRLVLDEQHALVSVVGCRDPEPVLPVVARACLHTARSQVSRLCTMVVISDMHHRHCDAAADAASGFFIPKPPHGCPADVVLQGNVSVRAFLPQPPHLVALPSFGERRVARVDEVHDEVLVLCARHSEEKPPAKAGTPSGPS